VNTPARDTAVALGDVFQGAGYASVWLPGGRGVPLLRGATAGIWDGGQLSKTEENDLAAFCNSLRRDAAPVVAMLDFPRRDRCELARQLGAQATLGKPWMNAELVATIEHLITCRQESNDVRFDRAA
jgi:hypothetical protein